MQQSIICPLMDHQLLVDYLGKVAPCCHYKDSYDIEHFRKIIDEKHALLKQGIQIPECIGCWEKENNNVRSVRQQGIDDVKWGLFDNAEPGDIVKMDIRLHNKCNLACSMCHPKASSLWAKLQGHAVTDIIISDEQSDIIKSNMKNLKVLSMQGGEPFYGNEYIEFINSIPNKHNVSIDIFSNMITAKMDVLEKWQKEFKQLIIGASVDGIGSVYDEIRWPTTWEKFANKAVDAYAILDHNLRYHYAIQAQNLTCFPDFLVWIMDTTPNAKITAPHIVAPNELSIFASTQNERDEFAEKYAAIKQRLEEWNPYDIGIINATVELISTLKDNSALIDQRNQRMQQLKEIRSKMKGAIA